MKIRRTPRIAAYLFCAILCAIPARAMAESALKAEATFKLKVKLPSSGVDMVNAISTAGRVYKGTKAGDNVTISIPAKKLAGTSLFATNAGKLIGPVYSPDGSSARLVLVKSPVDSKKKKLAKLTLTLKAPASGENFVLLKSAPKGNVFDKRYKYTASSTPALGYAAGGNAVTTGQPVKVRAAAPADSDGDGVVNPLDSDVDGDGLSNIVDSSVSLASIGKRDVEQPVIPYTTMYLPSSQMVNWHINGALDSSAIDAAIGGENIFAVALFFSLGSDESSGVTGGNAVCDSSMAYCRPTSGGTTGTAVYSGFSEGDQTLPGQLWSAVRSNSAEYGLESFSVGGSSPVFGASFQPRVGPSQLLPGHVYRVDFTNSSGATLLSKTMTLPPYFLTAPALRAFNVTSSDPAGDVLINYSDSSSPGSNMSSAIVLPTSGDFAGKLRVNFWRLQRLTLSGESGSYRDVGHLNYGMVISNNSGEYTCGGLYTDLSSSLTEASSVGAGGSFLTRDGANIWPLVDGEADFQPSNASDAETLAQNTLGFTVDLASCLDRNGTAPGTYLVTLIAAGSDTGRGANRAAHNLFVTIP